MPLTINPAVLESTIVTQLIQSVFRTEKVSYNVGTLNLAASDEVHLVDHSLPCALYMAIRVREKMAGWKSRRSEPPQGHTGLPVRAFPADFAGKCVALLPA